MAFLLQKFRQAVKVLAKSPKFARDPRHLQFEADVNRLFLYTSFNRLGECADEKDADEIIEMANKASVTDQQKQVQENIHFQAKIICKSMDEILCPDPTDISDSATSVPSLQTPPRRSGLGFAVGGALPITNHPVIPKTKPLTRQELSDQLKDHIGYTMSIKPSQIPHKEAGSGLFIDGEASVGSIIAFYPGIIYSPAYYRHIPGYPRVDSSNSYLITRYDGIIINAQPWGYGGETRDIWDGSYQPQYNSTANSSQNMNDKFWTMLSKPLDCNRKFTEVLERRNPLAFGHFANHPAKGVEPNVMVCPYDFPVSEADMRVYIPNFVFGSEESSVNMKRFGSFWFRSGSVASNEANGPCIKTLALVATRALKDEEVFLNYRLSNSKRRPSWYSPVNEEEDRRRWS